MQSPHTFLLSLISLHVEVLLLLDSTLSASGSLMSLISAPIVFSAFFSVSFLLLFLISIHILTHLFYVSFLPLLLILDQIVTPLLSAFYHPVLVSYPMQTPLFSWTWFLTDFPQVPFRH